MSELSLENVNIPAYDENGENTFLGFKNGKLVSVVISIMDNYNDAVDCDYHSDNPENAEKQIKELKLETLSE